MLLAQVDWSVNELSPIPGNASEWVRLPKPRERCPLTGLSRTSLVEVIQARDPKTGEYLVVQYTKKRHGKQRGIRMIHRASLLNHLQRQAEKESHRQWTASTNNPRGYTVNEVCGDWDLWRLFMDSEGEASCSVWEEMTRGERISRLDELGLLAPVH